KRKLNFDGHNVFSVPFGSHMLSHSVVFDVGDQHDISLCKLFPDFLIHISFCGIFVFMEAVIAGLLDILDFLHNLSEFYNQSALVHTSTFTSSASGKNSTVMPSTS